MDTGPFVQEADSGSKEVDAATKTAVTEQKTKDAKEASRVAAELTLPCTVCTKYALLPSATAATDICRRGQSEAV